MGIKIFKDSKSSDSLGNKFRQKRFAFFQAKIDTLDLPLNILDLGGTESYWINRGFGNKKDIQITLLNLKKQATHHHNFISISGNATDLSNFSDNEFDIVFSNSVIEHLYTLENQTKMAKEAQRVGKYYFIQTPNKFFIIEPHFLLPFFQFLPKALQYFILTKTKLSRMKKWNSKFAKNYIEEIRLISKKEMKILFPSSKIYKEKILGLTKSFTSHNF